MDVVELAEGTEPPTDADCIRIYSDGSGQYELMCSALCDGDSVSFVGDQHYATVAAAIDVGLAWANEVKVASIYVAINPPLSEADKPL